ncbi:hypothetical protein [Rhizobium sp. BK602]|uniref:hypothetical protein n=1 Tax=Rhizobium sp. BK602 TaxID=2586986 RepID=UPI00161203A4|nr:hypothetical protein [Rhizobium sp. BK602]MBB3609525.1 hypothetical protein [Rhizobium sp. BK602]
MDTFLISIAGGTGSARNMGNSKGDAKLPAGLVNMSFPYASTGVGPSFPLLGIAKFTISAFPLLKPMIDLSKGLVLEDLLALDARIIRALGRDAWPF